MDEENEHSVKLGTTGEVDFEFNQRSEICADKGKEEKDLGSTNSKCVDSLSPSSVKKGLGLKRWKRIPRDSSKSVNSSKVVIEELPDPVVNPTKRGSVYNERQHKSDASLVGGLGDSSLFDATKISQNGQEQTSSSTSIDDVKINYEIPLVVGSPNDKSRTSLGGKSLVQSVQRGKARIQAKKPRGERIKIDKHSSGNGIHAETTTHPDVENDDEVSEIITSIGDEIQHDNEVDNKRGSQEVLPEDVVTKPCLEVKDVKNENHDSQEDKDPFVEVIFELQTVQEALGKELLMIKEITKDGEESVFEHFPCAEFEQSFSENVKSTGLKRSTDIGYEEDDLLRTKIEAGVVDMVITGTVKELRSLSFTQITASEEQKAQVPRLVEQYDELVNTENNSKDIAKSEVKTIFKHASYFIIQLLLLLFIIALVSHSSLNNEKIFPT